MSRPHSTIQTINGKEYRVTPLDRRHEQQCAEWNKQHMRVISTRVPAEVHELLQEYCNRHGVSIYEMMHDAIAQMIGEIRTREAKRDAASTICCAVVDR